jgi:N-acetylmuramoyl-L-alanine amidase
MPITRDTPYRDVGMVPYDLWHSRIAQAGGRAELASRTAWIAAGTLSGVLLRILNQESSYDTDYAANAPYTNNPYNIRVPDRSNEGNPKGYVAYPSLVDATDAARRRLEGRAGFFEGPNPYAKTVSIRDLLYTYAPPAWNDTEGLIRAMVRDLNAWLPNWSPPVTTPSTPEEPIPMQVTLPIKQQMIPFSNDNRPGDKLNNAPLWITIHDTGNPSVGADAQMHADFVYNGGGEHEVSFHGTVDDHEAFQMLPADEVGWHAGDGCNDRSTDLGCFQSFAIETCVNADGNWAQTKLNLIDFVAAIITGDPRINFAGRKGQFSVDRIAQHNKWSGKDCPHRIRAEGSWNAILTMIRARVAQLQGGTIPPTYATPDKPPAGTHIKNGRLFLAVTEEYTLTKAATPYQYADYKNPTGPVKPQGSKIKVTHVVSDAGETADLTLVIEDGSRMDGKVVA